MLIVAHRGASAEAPENTLEAFERALALGVDGVEFDVLLTADGIAVISHDDELDRTAAVPARISAMTFEQVRTIDVGMRHAGAPARVPTFDEVVDLLAGRAELIIEVKGVWNGSEYLPAAAVVDVIAPRVRQLTDVVVSSFDADAVSHARERLPGVRTGLANLHVMDAKFGLEIVRQRGFDDLHLPEAQVSEAVVAAARSGGTRVLAWTVNDVVRLDEIARLGCDGVFSDDPATLLRARDRYPGTAPRTDSAPERSEISNSDASPA